MNKKVLQKLEFNKILEAIAGYAQTSQANDRILSIEPYDSEYYVLENQKYLKQAYLLLSARGVIPLRGYKSVADFVKHAQKGGVLREAPLKAIASACKSAYDVRRYIMSEEGVTSGYDDLIESAEEIKPLTQLVRDIDEAIISESEISDNASPGLASVRRKIRNANASIKDKLSGIVSGNTKKYLQDSLVTVRNGRYVVPVRSEYKTNIDGIVHDTSASGMTLFVEPAAVVKLNNELRELESEEKREIEAILEALSAKVAAEALYICHNEEIVFMLDVYFSQAQYALHEEHTCPKLSEEKTIDLLSAFHPLIGREKAVASDIALGGSYTQIVITGPNTGGKTVALKTLGICALMGACGLFVPAAEGSTICLFDEIFADIGDEQSIAQSLSTFSAHMTNIVEILSKTGENTLVLLDELCAGTDPTEGAALAKAVLSYIKASGALSVATTHYNEIKQYALYEPNAVNASVEFDTVNLKPTYKLRIGVPGKSNAFEISRRLGLSQNIIDAAYADMKNADTRFEDVLDKLNEKLRIATQESEAASRLRLENERIEAGLKAEESKLDKYKEKLYSDAATKAKEIINDAKNTAKDMIGKAANINTDKDGLRRAKENIDAVSKDALERANSMIPQHKILKEEKTTQRSETFIKDDEVYVKDINATGIIISIEKNTALVQVGAIKTKLPLSKLTHAPKKKEKVYSYTGMKSKTAKSSLDIRGITAIDVEFEIEKFLDDASLAGLKVVTVVHGKGEGVLREEVNKVLKSHPLVESFRMGGLAEGGAGATIVYLS